MISLHAATIRTVDVETLYRILQLRVDVFVVEQKCAYPELDGRDLEAGAVLHWATDGPAVVATLRVLDEPTGEARIGRVATTASARGQGVAARLMQAALESLGSRVAVLGGQSQLVSWYARFGFVIAGPEYLEDGIAHLPMRRVVLAV